MGYPAQRCRFRQCLSQRLDQCSYTLGPALSMLGDKSGLPLLRLMVMLMLIMFVARRMPHTNSMCAIGIVPLLTRDTTTRTVLVSEGQTRGLYREYHGLA